MRQTVHANEWVIVEDGPLTDEMYALLAEFQAKYPLLIKRVPLTINQGLGKALRAGILHCGCDLIARMDTDDIAREDRFEKQLALFSMDPQLDICGSHILEFDGNTDNIHSKRSVPLDDVSIKRYQKRRDGLNHVSVMFKKSAVLSAGNYESCLLMEDTLLWTKMFLNGAKAQNVDDYLVYVRIGTDMFERRGGLAYFKKYKAGRKRVYQTGYISWWDYVYTLAIQFVVALMPIRLRGWVFTRLLHG
ncbi:UDP-Gal:alpha-D-GlcNAc-diphosphoundecaprenol beta-1,3-galactosyltransferase [bioreactor metagenome]|uniref:UDP-Gal:alpha-D-GlcNAc-diphosphoundecaprenol beta-1,3-galactosyltransferase n=1 Tax=bioreactor metagenome TaxID=1076179 RepID=A0A645FCQ2_9ZZZZ